MGLSSLWEHVSAALRRPSDDLRTPFIDALPEEHDHQDNDEDVDLVRPKSPA